MNALPQPPFHDYEPPKPPGFAGSRRPVRTWWKRVLWGGAIGLALIVALVVIGVVVLLHSTRFHAYLLRTAQQKASESLGGQVEIRDFTLHLSGFSPSVDAYNIVLHGASPYQNLPLLQVDKLHVQLTITSLLSKSWYVRDLRIERPIVHILADRQGRTNLPSRRATSQQQSRTNVFDLGIRHLLLNRGEIYYNDLRSELTADVQHLVFQSRFDPAQERYSGTLSYFGGHVSLKHGNPVPHDLNVRFSATPQKFTLESASLTAGSTTRASLAGEITDYAEPKLHATYSAIVDSGQLRRAISEPGLPSGVVRLSGAVDYSSAQNRPFLTSAVVDGEVSSTRLVLRRQNTRLPIYDLRARYSLERGNARITGLHLRVLGGTLTATVSAHNLTGATKTHLSTSVHGISLAQLQQILASSTASRVGVQGSLDATADATWGKTMQSLVVRADASLMSSLQPPHGGAGTPIRGLIHASYRASTEELSIVHSSLYAPQTSLMMDGTIRKNSALQIQLQSNELHDLEGIAMAFSSPGSAPLGVYGRASLAATVTGSINNPQVHARLAADELRVKTSTWKQLRATAYASPSTIRVENCELYPANQGRITLQLNAGLKNWSFENSSSFNAKLGVAGVNVGDLVKAAGGSTPVTGVLSADVVASGTQNAPMGHGSIRLVRARVADEPIRAVNLQVRSDGKQLNGNLTIDLPTAGSLNANLQYEPAQKGYAVDLRAPGIKLDQLATLKSRNLQVAGQVNVLAEGRGTLNDPQLQARVEVSQLRVQDQIINGLKFQSDIANHVARFAFDSQLAQTYARGRGTVGLTGDYPAEIAFDTQAIPLAPLLAMYAPAQAGNLGGQTELHVTARGPLKDKSRLEAHIVVPQFSLNYKDTIQLAAAAPIHADYAHGVLDLQRTVVRGTGTELTLQARIPSAKNGSMSLLAKGTMDLRLAQLVSPDITSRGQLQFDIDSFGSLGVPNVQGQIRIVNASFTTVDSPVGLEQGNGTLTLTRDHLDINQFRAKIGGGEVTASGAVVYRPSLRFDLGMTAKDARIVYAETVRANVSSKLALTGNLENALLQGQVGIDQLSFTPDFDLAEFMNQFGGEATPAPSQGFSQKLRLEVGVATPGGVNMSSRTLSVAGNANLQIHGTAAEPVVLGRVNCSQGDLIFSGNRYILQNGTIDFRNPQRTEPVLDVTANTTIDQYDIQMHFWGPADHLHTNYASNPSLPPADIINLIAFGKTSEAAAANPTPPGSLGAESVVASQLSSQVTNRIEKLAGISQLSIDPQLGAGQQSTGPRVAVQQRVTGKIFVTFSTDVTATQQEVITFEYRMSRKTSFEAVRDQNGGFSFQTSFTKGW